MHEVESRKAELDLLIDIENLIFQDRTWSLKKAIPLRESLLLFQHRLQNLQVFLHQREVCFIVIDVFLCQHA